VAGLLRDLTVLDEVARTAGHRVAGPRRWLVPGDALAVRLRLPGGVHLPVSAVVRAVGTDVVSAGPVLTAALEPAGTGTTVRLRWVPPRLRAALGDVLRSGSRSWPAGRWWSRPPCSATAPSSPPGAPARPRSPGAGSCPAAG
jgi:hypothetical protein